MTQHRFSLNIAWPDGRNGVGELAAKQLSTKVSIPKEMDGPNVGTNPDEMLLGAAATCYVITLAAMLERSRIQASLSLTSEGYVDVTNGIFTYEEIHHHIVIELNNPDDRARRFAEKYAYKAEETCMISKSLKGNVKIIVHVTIK